jgi:uncharacterized protein
MTKQLLPIIPPTESELDRLDEYLRNFKSGIAMNLEEMDGFFSALIAGPENVPMSEYLPEVFGGEPEFKDIDEANEILQLFTRQWNLIAAELWNGDVHTPILLEDADGVTHGNDWANGFMNGVDMRRESWSEIFGDDDRVAWMLPTMILYHEHDDDPEMRSPPITPDDREEIIALMLAGLVRAYRHFRPSASGEVNSHRVHQHSPRSKVGRNDLCPCGSGKKYKRCCGG